MRNRLVSLCAAALAVGASLVPGTVFAGGQQIAAEISPDGKRVLVHTYRCGTPAAVAVTGSAEGLVNGQRRQMPLTITRTDDPAVFSIARQWPEDGVWVLTLTGSGERSASALVELAPGPKLKIASQESRYTPAELREVDAALARQARK
jgi:hypothetical protein